MSTVADWAGLIAPVTTLAGVLGGYWLAGHNDEGRDVRAAQREEAARVADYAKHLWDRRHEWQRQLDRVRAACPVRRTVRHGGPGQK